MQEVAETGMTVLLSSHVLADLEGICDHLLLLRAAGSGSPVTWRNWSRATG